MPLRALAGGAAGSALTTTDADGTVRGTTYDGFLRPLLSTVTLPGGTLGVLAQMSYLGFGLVPPDSNGRRVALKRFTDPVAKSAAATALGRVSTTYFDELGRTRMTLVALGSDYAGDSLVVGARTYDVLGRVAFEADPYALICSPRRFAKPQTGHAKRIEKRIFRALNVEIMSKRIIAAVSSQ